VAKRPAASGDGDRPVDAIGQVLAQRSATRDVEQLHAAADGEHGQAARLA
jgi:hypothetical protein